MTNYEPLVGLHSNRMEEGLRAFQMPPELVTEWTWQSANASS